jgi:small GTP-binding protein
MSMKNSNFKLVLLGDTAVGKSCLATRHVSNKFYDYQEPTIGAAFLTSKIIIDDNIVKFEIWDTAGQERYRSLAPMYYRGAKAAVVVYDITCEESFNGAKSWVGEVLRKGNKNCVIALVGNKSDLESDRKVNIQEVEDFVNRSDIFHMKTSAKTAYNIKELFDKIGKKLLIEYNINLENQNIKTLDITQPENKYRNGKCC